MNYDPEAILELCAALLISLLTCSTHKLIIAETELRLLDERNRRRAVKKDRW